MPSYELVSARSLAEACELLAVDPARRPLAGGTDLMVLFAAGKLTQTKLVDVWRVPELRGASETADSITLGALTTYTDVQANATLRREFPSLCAAAGETGGWAIQNRGTLGGNVANASPAADSPPALLVYEAEIELASAAGRRWVPYAGFHTGYKQTVMRAGELISSIRLPRHAGDRVHYFRKVGARRAQAISKVVMAGCADGPGGAGGVRIAIGSVGPTTLLCPATAACVARDDADGAAAAIAREIAPIDDVRSTARYRLAVAQNLARDFTALVSR